MERVGWTIVVAVGLAGVWEAQVFGGLVMQPVRVY